MHWLSLVAGSGASSSCGAWASCCGGFSCCGVWATWCLSVAAALSLVAPLHGGSSWTRDWTSVPCIGRQILNHWTTREVPPSTFTSMVKTIENPWPSCPPPTMCMGPKSLIFGSHPNMVGVFRDPGLWWFRFKSLLLLPIVALQPLHLTLSIPGFLHSQNSNNRSCVRKFYASSAMKPNRPEFELYYCQLLIF